MSASVAYFAAHPLGIDCLEILDEFDELTVEAVVTFPEGHDGWWDGSVHEVATKLGHTVYEIDEAANVLEHDVEYLLSVFYPCIVGDELLDHPTEGALNLHPAELPRYRGANAFSHAILDARSDDHWKQGASIHFMTDEVDAGDIVARRFVTISESDTARSLYEKARRLSVELFEDVLPDVASGRVHEMRTPQSTFDGPVNVYRKDSLEEYKEIDPEEFLDPDDELALYDRVRALDFPPFEPAYVELGGKKLYVTASSYRDLRELEWTA